MPNKSILLTATFLTLLGCTAPDYRASVSKFGEATQVAAIEQKKRLNALTDRQRVAIRGKLTEDRVILNYSPECATLAIPGSDIKSCKVVGQNGRPLSHPETFTSIAALNTALSDYGLSLSKLAQDVSEDGAAFSTSLIDLAASVDALDAALGQTDDSETEKGPKRQASATIIGALGNAVFASMRTAKLRQVIIEADPHIQRATQHLSRASEALLLSEVTSSIDQIESARTALLRAVQSGAKDETIAKLQGQVFSEVETLRRNASIRDAYVLIGKTHGELAKASQSNASLSDLRADLVELAVLAKILLTEAAKI